MNIACGFSATCRLLGLPGEKIPPPGAPPMFKQRLKLKIDEGVSPAAGQGGPPAQGDAQQKGRNRQNPRPQGGGGTGRQAVQEMEAGQGGQYKGQLPRHGQERPLGRAPSGSQAGQQQPCVRHALRAEEQPREGDQGKGGRAAKEAGSPALGGAPAGPPGGQHPAHLVNTVDAAPGHKGPVRPVPQPAEQKYRHDIEAPAGQAPPAPAQGDVHVVGKPGRQADVPPPPELPDGAGGIGGLEIFHQLHAQKPCRPPGDVGVAGKVTIDLQTKQRRGGDDLRAGRLAGGGVHRVHQGGEAVGDGRLFEIARQQQPSARGKLLPGQGPLPAQLGQQAAGALDGPGHQLGEKGDEQRVIAEVPLRGGPAPVYVQHVGQGLEGVKGDAHRQQQPPCGAARDQPGEKARVFEHAQAAQAGAQRHCQAGPSDGRGPFPGRAQPAQPGGRSYGHQQQPRHRLPPEVKQPAGRQQ